MKFFWEIVASNAVMVVVLGAGVALLGRLCKNPSCLHLLWVLVLLKLVTPAAVTVPIPFSAGQPPPISKEHAASQELASRSPVQVPRQQSTSMTAGDEDRHFPAVESQIGEAVGRIGNPSCNPPDAVRDNDRATSGRSDITAASFAIQRQPSQGTPWLTILGWVWAAGIVLFASRNAYRVFRFRTLLRDSQAPSLPILSMAEETARRLGLRRVPEIRMLPICVSPLVWSLGGRPRVFLPAALLERLDEAAKAAILTHELAHVRRKDHWVRLLELVITTLFWWHPVVWWVAHQLQELEDQCCDAMVVGLAPHAARTYATALLDTLDFLSERSVAAPLGATAAKSSTSLARRIAMLKNRPSTARLTLGRLMLLLTVAALPMALAFGQKPPQATEKSPQPPVQRRAVNKLVKDFPEKTDLSTPESALAAACRSLARKDIQGVLELSWVRPWHVQTAKDLEDALKHDPNAPKIFDQHILDTKIIEVLTYHDDCAAVICKVDETVLGKGAGPYLAAVLGRINGTWKCIDEVPSSSSPERVVERFEKNKDDVWRRFVEVRNDLKNGRTPTIRSAFFATVGPSEQPAVHKRAINKLVKDFPEKADLSTPESALAAFSRRVARGDMQAGLELSWVKLDPQSAKDAAEQLKDALAMAKDFSRQVLDTQIVEVLTYHGDLAAVIHKSDLLPPKRPYGAQHFGRIYGKWMNLDWLTTGEDVFPSVAAAEETFEKTKDQQWKSFVKVRNDVTNGRTPVFQNAKGKGLQPLSLSAAEKADIKRWQGETWQIGIDLDMPTLDPQAVQFAIFNEDPVPAFAAQVKRMQTHNRQQLEKADKEARREQLRAIQMTVGWDLGFKKVTGDDLYLLVKGPGYSRTGMSSNAPGGKKWIVTKTVQIEGKPVCWCIPVEVKTGKSIDVTFDKSNTFDLRSAYDRAMQAPAGVGDKAPPAPARKPDSGPSAASQFPHAVKFEQGATRFLPGDKIAILEVRGTAATFSPGNIYWIKGTYTLASRDRATLSAYTTAKDSANGTSTPLKAQSTVVTRGSGTFTLFLPMTCRGWAHVSFYPADGGEGFGGNYFGTGDSVLKRWWGAEETDRVK